MHSIGSQLVRRRMFAVGDTKASKLLRASVLSPYQGLCTSALSRRAWIRTQKPALGTSRASSNITIIPIPATSGYSLPPPRRSFPRRIFITLGLSLFLIPVGFGMAAAPVLQTISEMENTPTDEETLLLVNPSPEEEPAYEVNQTIINHPLAKQLSEDKSFIAARPHLKIPPSLRPHNFTGGTLVGPDMIPVPPLVFSTEDGTKLVQMQYLGSALCGHPGIVHGGLLATLLDEGLARCCFPGLPNKVAVTASLKVDYRKPCMANQYVVLKAETEKFEGRKAWVKGRLETLPVDGSPGEVLVEAEALFIEPRNAAILARGRKVIGETKVAGAVGAEGAR